jgi:S-adenosylmethionine hydrolase
MPIVTFTSDLGLFDYYVGIVKGAILTQAQDVNFIDITHNVDNFDIVQGAFILKNSYLHFPPGTIHLIYILFEKDGYYFARPNNGLFALVFDKMPDQVFEIGHDVDGSFPVKDIFAKVVGQLSTGHSLNEIADPVKNLIVRMNLHPVVSKSHIRGSIIHIDHFENVIVNIDQTLFEKAKKDREFAIYFKRFEPIQTISKNYNDAPVGETLCLFNSSGYLEIAINMGKASSLLGLKVDETIQIDFYDPS